MQLLPKVLMVEDTPTLVALYEEYLRREELDLVVAKTGKDAVDKLAKSDFDVILLDLKLPDMEGMDILRQLKHEGRAEQVIVMTAHASSKINEEATALGAADFIVKPFTQHRLRTTLQNALKKNLLSKQVQNLQKQALKRERFCGFVGKSLIMQSVYKIIEAAATSKATVFVRGESGTGKELVAEAVHQLSSRAKNGKLVALNCAAIPRDLLESELFGYVKGAFTGAVSDRDGAAKQAHNGTLFLDEIAELDIDLQAKLLRFVQTGSFRPIGGDKDVQVDTRIICATNKDPMEEIAAGRFREDLYYRLHVIPILLPPLRERGNDIIEISNMFIEQYSRQENKDFTRLSELAKQLFLAWKWPGNVRELQNTIHNIIVLNHGEEITHEMLPEKLRALPSKLDNKADNKLNVTNNETVKHYNNAEAKKELLNFDDFTPDKIEDIRPLLELERKIIEHAIELCDGNIPRAAGYLGISPSTIYRKKATWD